MATTNRLFQDFISFVTDTDPGVGGLSLSAPGLADLLVVADPDFIALTLDPEEVDGAPEIVWVSAHTASATTATIVRAQEGSAARAHPISTVVVAGISQDAIAELVIGQSEAGETSENTNTALTSSWADGASDTFTKPSSWNTYKIKAVAHGTYLTPSTVTDGSGAWVRADIGGVASTQMGWASATAPTDEFLSFVATLTRTGLSSASTVVKTQSKGQFDDLATKISTAVEYVAIRES